MSESTNQRICEYMNGRIWNNWTNEFVNEYEWMEHAYEYEYEYNMNMNKYKWIWTNMS